MDKSSRLKFLFSKYLQKQSSPAELDEMIQLLRELDAEHELSEEMKVLWDRTGQPFAENAVDWNKMYASIVSSGEETDGMIRKATMPLRKTYLVLTLAILILIGIPAYWLITHSSKTKPLAGLSPSIKLPTTKMPNRQTIHLPDGSTVILNEGSRLNYPSVFAAGRREVYLSGEGFFDIVHNAAAPFMVHSGKLIVRVLGTAFNIKAYEGTDQIEVTVTRGKVQVLKQNKSLGILTPSQQISFANNSELAITRKVDTGSVIGWRPAAIIFNDITMEEAASSLEQRFKLKVSFSNPSIRNCRVSATFSEDDPADEILAVICGVTKSTFKMNDDKITIEGKGCN